MRLLVSRGLIAVAIACSVGAVPAFADDDDRRPAAGIQDNSFLIEEAYNQEKGIVQHIATLRRLARRDWHFTFTEEWPLGTQLHQFSYSVPYSWLRNDEGERVQGFGDVRLNYRYQFWTEKDARPAFAPRLTLIVPTGGRSLGDGSYGLETLLPFSKIVSDRVTLHANAGMSRLFDVDGHSPTNYVLGGSAIYAVTREFNLMLEALGEWEETVNDMREIERQFTFTINPGFRKAINFPDKSQLVMGFSTPIAMSKGNAPDYGLFFYLSFEHSFLPKRKK